MVTILKSVLQKNLEVLNSSASCMFSWSRIPIFVFVKSRATCPHIQPVAISEILLAGTRLSIFSFRLMLVLSRSIVTPFFNCTTLPKMSLLSHSKVSFARAEPDTTLPTVVIIFCIPLAVVRFELWKLLKAQSHTYFVASCCTYQPVYFMKV